MNKKKQHWKFSTQFLKNYINFSSIKLYRFYYFPLKKKNFFQINKIIFWGNIFVSKRNDFVIVNEWMNFENVPYH